MSLSQLFSLFFHFSFVKGKFIGVILAFISKLKACFNLHTTNIVFFICDFCEDVVCLFIYLFPFALPLYSPIHLLMLKFIFIYFV